MKKNWMSKIMVILLALGLVFTIVSIRPIIEVNAAGPIYRVVPGGLITEDCGDTWANACDLQYALMTLSGSGDELWVKTGIYTPTTTTDRTVSFVLKDGVALYGGFAGTEESRDERDWEENVTILSGDIGTAGNSSDNSYHVVTGVSGATLDGVTISGGNANGSDSPNDLGGGMYNDHANPTVINVTFSGNSAAAGGGMDNVFSSPTLTNVTFSSNSAAWSGGGIYNYDANPTLTNVTFSGNSATYGGGMINDSASPTVINVTFSGNSAADGGGMFNDHASPTVINVTFSGNSAGDYGGGMYNNSSGPVMQNTVLWGDSATNGAEIYNSDSTTTISSSDIQGCMPSGVWNTACGTDGGGNLDADPLLGALGDYGGFTQTLPLLPGSPAIDTADNASCPATDQRGVDRPQGAGCDMGAYESRGFTLTKNSGDDQAALVNTPFAEPLVVSVSSPYDEPVDGGLVTFTAPLSGPSAIPQTNIVTIISGTVSQSLTANGESGGYSVMVDTAGAVEPSIFMLKNLLAIYLPVIIR